MIVQSCNIMSILVPIVSIFPRNHRYNCLRLVFISKIKYNFDSNNNENGIKRPMVMEQDINPTINNTDDDLEEPTTCCMSGCANCVWIQYAEKLSDKVKNSNDDVQKIILSKVSDPNMRAFLSMELRCRNLVK